MKRMLTLSLLILSTTSLMSAHHQYDYYYTGTQKDEGNGVGHAALFVTGAIVIFGTAIVVFPPEEGEVMVGKPVQPMAQPVIIKPMKNEYCLQRCIRDCIQFKNRYGNRYDLRSGVQQCLRDN